MNSRLILHRFFNNLQIRHFTVTVGLGGQGRMMKKLMSPTRKQRKLKYMETPIVSSTNTITSITNDGKRSVNTKRINVLNKLFMRHITDLMSTGSCSEALTGYGIEVNKVKIAPDFKRIQVYWLVRSDAMVENVEEILKIQAGNLRHELSQLHIMGVVPKIEFVKDVQCALLKLLDDKLSKADYGEDHVPFDNTNKLKNELQLQTYLDPKIRDQIENIEEEETDYEELNIPDMPQNVLGLNHSDIMQRVLKNMKKSQGFYRNTEGTTTEGKAQGEAEFNKSPVTYSSTKVQREAFRDFLTKRQLIKQKLMKEDKDDLMLQYGNDYFEDERKQKYEELLRKYDFHEYLIDDKDYITEDDNDENDQIK